MDVSIKKTPEDFEIKIKILQPDLTDRFWKYLRIASFAVGLANLVIRLLF